MPSPVPPATFYIDHINFSAGAYDIDLPNPQFGNNEKLETNLVTHISPQKRYEKFVREESVLSHTNRMRFERVSKTTVDIFKQFLRDFAGQEVEYTDMESVSHTVIIVTTNLILESVFERVVTINDTPTLCREYSFEIEFIEG